MKKLILLFLLTLLYFTNWGQEKDCIICLSHPSGFYKTPIQLELTSSKDSAQIFYTLDGTSPSSSDREYKEPILLDTVKALRIALYTQGRKIKTETHTYFINRPVSMGVVSIVTDPDNFFSYDRGIYVKGCCAGETSPYSGANFWKGWEREVNIEFFEQNGERVINQGAGVRIFGGFSKGLPMKSLSLTARNKYGNNRFNYQFFDNKKLNEFKSIILRNSGGDFNKTHFRDALFTNLVEPLDLDIQAYRPVTVFINGEYWGIHNLREKLNEHYLKYNGNAIKDSVDLLKHRLDLQHGNRKQYQAFLKFLRRNDLADTSIVDTLATFMDIENFMNHNITQIYLDNRDAGGNIRYWKPQNNHSKWRWILFDTDMSFGISDWKGYKTNTLKQMTTKSNEGWPNPAWSTFIIRKLLENDSLKNRYINLFADRLNTIFSSKNVRFKIDSIQNLLNEEMPFHVKKWRSNNMERWERNIGILKDFADQRPYYLRRFLMGKFELTDTLQVNITPPNKKEGKIKLNSLKIKKEFNGYYFNEVPIQLSAKPKLGYEFIEWKGINEKSPKVNYTLTSNISVTPIFKQKTKSKFQQQVVINEICVKSKNDDWIEFYNNTDTTISLKNWKLILDKETITLDSSAIIAPRNYLVIAKKPKQLGDILPVYNSSLPKGISSKKGFVALLDYNLAVVDSFRYHTKRNFKTDSIYIPIILEKVKPNCETNVGNWNLNNLPTLGKRNRAFKEPKVIEKTILELYEKDIIIGIIGFFVLLIILILIIRRRIHLSKIG